MPNLPKHAQEVYQKAYEKAIEQFGNAGNPSDRAFDETAHKMAWAAVKQEYLIDYHTGDWKRKTRSEAWPYSLYSTG